MRSIKRRSVGMEVVRVVGRRTITALALLLLAGCTTHGRIGALPEAPTTDAAEIVVIREWRLTTSASNLTVTLDGMPVYGIGPSEHIVLVVASAGDVLDRSARRWD